MILYSANLQHGEDSAGETNFSRQVEAVADTDIVCVQERTTGETGWNAALTTAGLSQEVFKSHLGSAGDGNAIWVRTSTVTVLATYATDLAPTGGSPILGWDGVDVRRAACALKVQVEGRQFYVVCVHLVASSGEDDSNTNFAAQRVTQAESLLSWESATLTGGLPRILAGDFNFPPNYPRAPERTYTASSTTGFITSTAHGFPEGAAVVLRNDGGAPPSPLLVGSSLYATATVYYVRDVGADTFRLSASLVGPPISLTTDGSGTNFISATQWGLFHAGHYDLWQEGLIQGVAVADWNGDMPLDFQLTRTHDTRRIDYPWLDRASHGVVVREISVPDLRDGAGVTPSDHNFVRVELDLGVAPVRATQFSWFPYVGL